MKDAPELLFPYMFWAHGESVQAPYCLSQSGMPAPDPRFLEVTGPPELGPPPAHALPEVEGRLAALFGVDPERVIVTLGASGAMYLAALCFFPGARVATGIPGYEALRALTSLHASSAAWVRRRPEEGFRLDPERVARELAGARPGHVFLCNPHNPTGALSSADEVAGLARVAEQSGGILVSNEVYMEFAPPERRFHAFHLAPNALSIGSLTKAYGLGALRIGWIVLGEGLARERAALLDRAYLVWVDPPSPSLMAASAALERLARLLEPLRRLEHESRPRLAGWLAESERVEGALGPFGLAAFPRVLGVDDTLALAGYLLTERGVAVVPGEHFGLAGHVRVGYGLPEATLAAGLAELEAGISDFLSRSG